MSKIKLIYKKNLSKIMIIVDAVMVVLFVGLMASLNFSIWLHEVFGIILAPVVVLHLILNWRWIKTMFAKLFRREKMPRKSRNLFILNMLLFIMTGISIVSGVMVSQALFPMTPSNFAEVLHGLTSDASILLSILHIRVHWSYIKSKFIKTKKVQ